MRERAIQFGSHSGLVGIVTLPDQPATPKCALLMANIGLHHRAGPYRLFTELARRVAGRGLLALRFDLSGLGDSTPRSGTLGDVERGVLDMSEAMDWLQSKLGVERFILIGLCSGVDAIHPVATRDTRVTGAIFIDGYTYPTVGQFIRRHTVRYLQLRRWTRYFARRRAVRGTEPIAPAAGAAQQQMFVREYPQLSQFRADVRRMVDRGSRLLFIWTGTYSAYNSSRQLAEMLGKDVPRHNMTVQHLTAADHIFTAVEQRDELIARLEAWIVEKVLTPA